MSDPNYDPRYLCSLCGDLDYLLVNNLCRQCQPEPVRVAEWVEICMRAVNKVECEFRPRWRIG